MPTESPSGNLTAITQPKVFISYSWSSTEHIERIKAWTERLISDGVDVVMDIYDLKEGDDKYAYMEKMVTDETVTHVLLFCDRLYMEKADRKKDSTGVGTESQIVSGEIYTKTKQSKFIPVFCETSEEGYHVPVFLKTRIGIDFTTDEKVNENWQRLICLLYNKPSSEKPTRGTPPVYITNSVAVGNSCCNGKFQSLRTAIMKGGPAVVIYRDEFLAACYADIDLLRVRKDPDESLLPQQILDTCTRLKATRNLLIDWMRLEGRVLDEIIFTKSVIKVLQKLLELKSRPSEIVRFRDTYFLAHGVFVYETFLYTVALLKELELYGCLREVFSAWYESPENNRFISFRAFWVPAWDILQTVLGCSPGYMSVNTVFEVIKRQADRSDLCLADLKDAELLIMLMVLIKSPIEEGEYWYPHMVAQLPTWGCRGFFGRAAQRDFFKKTAIITGITTGNELRSVVKAAIEKETVPWTRNARVFKDLWQPLNMEQLDTLV